MATKKQAKQKHQPGRPQKSSGNPGGKTFGEIRENVGLIMRIGKKRETGMSFQGLEAAFHLRPASGMTAHRAYREYLRLTKYAKKNIRPKLEQVAGPGKMTIGDEPPAEIAAEIERERSAGRPESRDVMLGRFEQRLADAVAEIREKYKQKWNKGIERAAAVLWQEME
jgi:hypothetical protein